MNELLPITYFEGIKFLCNPVIWDTAIDFYEGKGDKRMIGNNGLQLSLPGHSISTFKICIC
jgi:hypothetical protein